MLQAYYLAKKMGVLKIHGGDGHIGGAIYWKLLGVPLKNKGA